MKFLADECCDAGLVNALRQENYDVFYALESSPGASDDVLLMQAFDEERILLTEDKDFGDLVYRLGKPAYGVILLRFDVIDRTLKIPRLREVLPKITDKFPGSFVVVEAHRTRIRFFRKTT